MSDAFSNRAAKVLCRLCPMCGAGWGLACRTHDGAIADFHKARLRKPKWRGVNEVARAPSQSEWRVLRAATR